MVRSPPPPNRTICFAPPLAMSQFVIPKNCFRMICVIISGLIAREALHGVGADGVGVKFPIFAVNCCCLPLFFWRSRAKRRKRGKMRRKRGKMRRKRGKMRKKKGENHSDPIYTNPIKNLPNSTSKQTPNEKCKQKSSIVSRNPPRESEKLHHPI